MADYYPLITRAVAGLEKSTGEGRRALYERARNALVEQLRSVTPALNETDITRERLALEEAIRKVEAEAVRQLRMEQAAERTTVPPLPHAKDLDETAAPALEPEAPPAAEEAEQQPEPAPPRPAPRPTGMPRRWLKQQPPPPPAEPSPGIKGFSDVVADAENLGNATAEAGRAARETYSSVPSPSPEFDRLEPRLDPAPRRSTPGQRGRAPERRAVPRQERQEYELDDEAPYVERNHQSSMSGRPLSSPAIPDSLRQVAERGRRDFDEDGEELLGRRLKGGMINIIIGAVVLLMVAGLVWWQGKNVVAFVKNTFTSSRTTSAPTPQRDAAQQRAKIPDRIGQTDTNTQARPQNEAAVAQRAVLYEDDPVEPAGKQFVGTVTWRTENSPPAAGQPPDRAIRAEIVIPERNMQVNLIIRRNTDPGLTASHTVSIMFTLPPDFPNGGVSEIRGMLMKQAEDTRGTSLAGLAVKVTPTFFLVGLSSASDGDVQRNLQLLKDRSWFDIAIVYNNGRRAILAVEKGGPGDRAFAEAFGVWRQ